MVVGSKISATASVTVHHIGCTSERGKRPQIHLNFQICTHEVEGSSSCRRRRGRSCRDGDDHLLALCACRGAASWSARGGCASGWRAPHRGGCSGHRLSDDGAPCGSGSHGSRRGWHGGRCRRRGTCKTAAVVVIKLHVCFQAVDRFAATAQQVSTWQSAWPSQGYTRLGVGCRSVETAECISQITRGAPQPTCRTHHGGCRRKQRWMRWKQRWRRSWRRRTRRMKSLQHKYTGP